MTGEATTTQMTAIFAGKYVQQLPHDVDLRARASCPEPATPGSCLPSGGCRPLWPCGLVAVRRGSCWYFSAMHLALMTCGPRELRLRLVTFNVASIDGCTAVSRSIPSWLDTRWKPLNRFETVDALPAGRGQARVFGAICERDDVLPRWFPKGGSIGGSS